MEQSKAMEPGFWATDGGFSAAPLDLTRRRHWRETVMQAFFFLCGAVSVLTTVGIVYVLGKDSLPFFRSEEVNLVAFFTGLVWQPTIGKFGILPLANSTFMTSVIAMSVALPLGLAIAIYLSEYASDRARRLLKPILEVLAGIPTVVYGYFALTFMTPLLRAIFGRDVVSIYNTASAGLVMGILILPLVSSMSEDALSAVPRSLREASYALGATKLETAVKVVLPAALSGVAAAVIVAISRAVGETMIVALAAGAGPAFTFNPFKGAETMTGHIVRISGGDISYDSIDYNSIFAIGLTLFVVTLILNIISRYVVQRFREVYE
jgi:phosphate transport system permease protein